MQGSEEQLPERKTVRLSRFDYSTPGAYFITICCQDMRQLFGRVVDGVVELNQLGEIAHSELQRIAEHHNAVIDTCILMPNHIHAILILEPWRFVESLTAGGPRAAPTSEMRKPPAIGVIVGLYKQAVTKAIRLLTGNAGFVIWRRGYHEHVVRDDEDLNTRRQYILANPERWALRSQSA